MGPLHPCRLVGTPQAAGEADEKPGREDAPEEKLGRLEAVLFLAREPLSTRKLASLAQLADGTEARTLARQLQQRYEGGGLDVVEVAGGLQLLTRPELADRVSGFCGEEAAPRLSPPAMETLTVVAYRQPVSRAEVEAIRGVRCGEVLRLLLEKGLLRIVGRSEALGRPFLYGTTRFFLQNFGLNRLDQLPNVDHIRYGPSGRYGQRRPKTSSAPPEGPREFRETLRTRVRVEGEKVVTIDEQLGGMHTSTLDWSGSLSATGALDVGRSQGRPPARERRRRHPPLLGLRGRGRGREEEYVDEDDDQYEDGDWDEAEYEYEDEDEDEETEEPADDDYVDEDDEEEYDSDEELPDEEELDDDELEDEWEEVDDDLDEEELDDETSPTTTTPATRKSTSTSTTTTTIGAEPRALAPGAGIRKRACRSR